MSRVKSFLVHPWVDFAVRICAFVSLAIGCYAAVTGYQLSRCQAEYNEAVNNRTRVLTDSVNQERAAEAKADDAQAALWTSPLIGKPATERTPEDQAELSRIFMAYQKALAEQQTERAEADALRAAHPVPPPPSRTCG